MIVKNIDSIGDVEQTTTEEDSILHARCDFEGVVDFPLLCL